MNVDFCVYNWLLKIFFINVITNWPNGDCKNRLHLFRRIFMTSVMKGEAVDTKMAAAFWDKNNDLRQYCRVKHDGDSFFYCNNPETLEAGDLADDGKFLTKNGVLGKGMLYTWHYNKTNKTIHSVILIYNPDTVPIRVTFTNIGLTNQSTGCDRTAWEEFYKNTRTQTVTVAPGSFASVLAQDVPNGNLFGKIAKYDIVFEGESGPGFAYFYDLAYYRDSGNAHDFAIGDDPGNGLINSRRRGVGDWYQNELTVTEIRLTETEPARAVTIGGIYAQKDDFMDSFFGDDMVEISGGSGREKEHDNGLLYGAYGLPIKFNFHVINNTSIAKEVRIFMGCNVAAVPVFAHFNGAFHQTDKDTYVKSGCVRDVITLGVVPAYGSKDISFDTANLAQSASPYYVGARLLV